MSRLRNSSTSSVRKPTPSWSAWGRELRHRAPHGVAGRPVRASDVEQALVGTAPGDEEVAEAAQAATAVLEPFSDVFGSASYRKRVAAAMVRRALTTALGRAGGSQ